MWTPGWLDNDWFYSLKVWAHFRPKQLVDFCTFDTQMLCLTGAIISKEHHKDKYNYVQDCGGLLHNLTITLMTLLFLHILIPFLLDRWSRAGTAAMNRRAWLYGDWSTAPSPSRPPASSPVHSNTMMLLLLLLRFFVWQWPRLHTEWAKSSLNKSRHWPAIPYKWYKYICTVYKEQKAIVFNINYFGCSIPNILVF